MSALKVTASPLINTQVQANTSTGRSDLSQVRLEIGACFDVLADPAAERRVDHVPLIRHLSRRLTQHLVDQVAVLLRLGTLLLRPRDNVAAVLSPALLV